MGVVRSCKVSGPICNMPIFGAIIGIREFLATTPKTRCNYKHRVVAPTLLRIWLDHPLSLARVVCIGVQDQRNYEIEGFDWSIGKVWIQGVLHVDQSLEWVYIYMKWHECGVTFSEVESKLGGVSDPQVSWSWNLIHTHLWLKFLIVS